MKRRTVIKTSVFPASKEVIFGRLKELNLTKHHTRFTQMRQTRIYLYGTIALF